MRRLCRQMVTVIRWVTDTIRPHTDYGRRLHTDLPQRLVRMRRGRRFPPKTPIGQSVCLTLSPYMEFEPSRHNPFVRPTGARMRMPPIIPHAPCTVTPAYLLFPGIVWPFLAEITFLSNTDRDKALCCRIHFGFIYRFTFSVCLPFSVTTAGLRQLYVSCRV